jgi:hypothetical protein
MRRIDLCIGLSATIVRLRSAGAITTIDLTFRETSDHSILEGFPTIQVFSKLPTEVFGRHVIQA